MKNDELIQKWLLNDLTEVELKEFVALEDYKLNNNILEKASRFGVNQDVDIRSYEDFKLALAGKKKKVVLHRQLQLVYKMAGIVIVGLGIYFLFFFNQVTTVQTLASQQISFELPDASSVVLNVDSKAEYSKDNWDSRREIELDGEAFFKVAKGSKFEVKTTMGNVSVLGTQFNVKNRPNLFEVTCFEGEVKVFSNGQEKILTKGKTYRVFQDVIDLDSVQIIQPSWLNKISNFKALPLSMVIDEFERQYDIAVDASKINTKLIFTGSFVNDNMEQALLSILEPFNIKHQNINSNKISLYKSE